MMSSRVPGLMPLVNALLQSGVVVDVALMVKTQPQVKVPALNLAIVVVPGGTPRYVLTDVQVSLSLRATVAAVTGRIQYKEQGFIDEVSDFRIRRTL